jgi:hypothetical protein
LPQYVVERPAGGVGQLRGGNHRSARRAWQPRLSAIRSDDDRVGEAGGLQNDAHRASAIGDDIVRDIGETARAHQQHAGAGGDGEGAVIGDGQRLLLSADDEDDRGIGHGGAGDIDHGSARRGRALSNRQQQRDDEKAGHG